MSDFATFPAGRSAAWLEMDRLIPDYNARVDGPRVDKVVLIESSVGVSPGNIIQSNRWMIEGAATESKILSVIGNLDVTQPQAGLPGESRRSPRLRSGLASELVRAFSAVALRPCRTILWRPRASRLDMNASGRRSKMAHGRGFERLRRRSRTES
jgi:hypothetical protein